MSTQPKRRARWMEWLGKATLRQIDFGLAILVTLAGLACFAFSGLSETSQAGFLFLRDIEQSSLDLRFELRGARTHDPRIVIVGIDEKTLQKIGSYPLPRDSYALLVNRLSAGGARIIALDATFPTPETNSARDAFENLKRTLGSSASPSLLKKINELEKSSDQDANFAAAVKNAGNVILGHVFLEEARAASADPKLAEEYFNIVWAKVFPQVLKAPSKDGRQFDMGQAFHDAGGTVYAGVEANIPKLAEAAASYGFININPDPDGTLRHALLIARYRDQDFFPSLDLQVVREYEKIPDQDIVAYIGENGVASIQFGPHQFRQTPDGTKLINYTGPYGTYAHYSMWDVMSGEAPPESFRDKIVLVGSTAIAIGDMRNTPFPEENAAYMGVEVHANIIDNILHSEERGRGFLTRGMSEEMLDLSHFVFRPRVWPRVRPGRAGEIHRGDAAHARWVRLVRHLHVLPAGPLAQLRDSRGHAFFELCGDDELSHDFRGARKTQNQENILAISLARRDRPHRKRSAEVHPPRRRNQRAHRDVQRHPRIHHDFRRAYAG